MVKRFFHALCVLQLIVWLATPALAGNQQPTDITSNPALSPVTYKAGTALNTFGASGSATTPDVPPYYAHIPADIPTPNRSNWMTVTDGTASYVTCSNPAVTCEAKIRFLINGNHDLCDDPLLFFNEPGASHCHSFAGNKITNSRATYQLLRTYSASNSTGGRLNATGYWYPCMKITNWNGTGKNYCVRIEIVGGYYKADNSVSPWLVVPPPTLDQIFGTNPADPLDTLRKREVIVANAQPGTGGRYGYRGTGFAGWVCFADTTGSGNATDLTGAQTANGQLYQPYLNSTDGQNVSDPWLGNCKTNTTSGVKATIYAEIEGADCWNGKNGWVVGAVNHVRMGPFDSQLNGSRAQRTCPDTWYHMPQLEQKAQYTTTGWADYQRWAPDSDTMFTAKLNSLPACTTDSIGAYANAPCGDHTSPLWNGSTFSSPHGWSFHGDWKMAWDGWTWKNLMARCMGIGGLYDGDGNITSTAGSLIPNTPHTCEPGVLIPNGTSTTFLTNGAPPTTDPQGQMPDAILVNQTLGRYDTGSASKMNRVRTTAPSGTASGHICMGTSPC